MGASNFYTKNASRHFIVLASYEETQYECKNCHHIYREKVKECEVCDSKDFKEVEKIVYSDDLDYDDIKHMLREELENIGFSRIDKWSNDRSYQGYYVAELNNFKVFGDIEIGFTIRVMIRIAYYDGATLDFDLFNYNGHEADEDDIRQDAEESFDYSKMNEGMIVIQRRNGMKWLDRQFDELFDKVENIFSKIAQHELRTIGTFSNGVSFYENY